ncbi:MAG: lasso RiPP family leader peptide-containing protein [Gemmatimonadota bacterium]|nr:lasso RiPP family leader peptide-containing protein [Gemmatimonadota bacterium]
MYNKPRVERFGTFRELTQQGFQGASDGITFAGTNGNNCQNEFLVNGQTTLVCIVGGGSGTL